jgi:hypothetical protein
MAGCCAHIVKCRPIVRGRLGKESRNKYATNNRVDTFLGNARSTPTQQYNPCRKWYFLCYSHICIARQRMLWSDPRLNSEKTTIIDSQLEAVFQVEAGMNSSTVILRVVGGDEEGSLESETVKYGRESHGTRTGE